MGNEVLYPVRFMASDGKLYGVDWRELLVFFGTPSQLADLTTSLRPLRKQSVHSFGGRVASTASNDHAIFPRLSPLLSTQRKTPSHY